MDKTELKKYVAEGLSERQIAVLTGKGFSTVHRWLKYYELKTSHERFNKKAAICSKCGENDSACFYGHKKSLCKKCGTNQSSRWKENKKLAVQYKGGCCKKCGYNKCFASMDFHHSDSSQKDPNWRKMRCRSLEKIKAELDKCVLLCKNCHYELHYGDDKI